MSKHYSSAVWGGSLAGGKGHYILKSSGYKGEYNFSSRFEDNKKLSSPEEMIGAAQASCYSMALSHTLDQSGYTPEKIETEAEVTLSKTAGSFSITEILLKTRGNVSGIDPGRFVEIANEAKETCPVSKALRGTNIRLEAQLVNDQK